MLNIIKFELKTNSQGGKYKYLHFLEHMNQKGIEENVYVFPLI